MKKQHDISVITGTIIGKTAVAFVNVLAVAIPAVIIWNAMNYIIATLGSTALAWNYVLMIALAISFLAVAVGTIAFYVIRAIIAHLILAICDKIVNKSN